MPWLVTLMGPPGGELYVVAYDQANDRLEVLHRLPDGPPDAWWEPFGTLPATTTFPRDDWAGAIATVTAWQNADRETRTLAVVLAVVGQVEPHDAIVLADGRAGHAVADAVAALLADGYSPHDALDAAGLVLAAPTGDPRTT